MPDHPQAQQITQYLENPLSDAVRDTRPPSLEQTQSISDIKNYNKFIITFTKNPAQSQTILFTL